MSAGEEIIDGDRRKVSVGTRVRRHGAVQTVTASCGGKPGFWHCVTCGYDCAHNLDKDIHCAAKRKGAPRVHELCWICPEHGPEVP